MYSLGFFVARHVSISTVSFKCDSFICQSLLDVKGRGHCSLCYLQDLAQFFERVFMVVFLYILKIPWIWLNWIFMLILSFLFLNVMHLELVMNCAIQIKLSSRVSKYDTEGKNITKLGPALHVAAPQTNALGESNADLGLTFPTLVRRQRLCRTCRRSCHRQRAHRGRHRCRRRRPVRRGPPAHPQRPGGVWPWVQASPGSRPASWWVDSFLLPPPSSVPCWE